jgi:hypothetical protein
MIRRLLYVIGCWLESDLPDREVVVARFKKLGVR